jgi:hypothetical protein
VVSSRVLDFLLILPLLLSKPRVFYPSEANEIHV